MKFRTCGDLCPICGKPRVSSFKGHIPGTPVHPECSEKMRDLNAQKTTKPAKKRLTEKSIDYLTKTGRV